MKKKKSDKAFIDKIKTINIGGGSGSCPECGEPWSEHTQVSVKVTELPSGFFSGLSGNPANN